MTEINPIVLVALSVAIDPTLSTQTVNDWIIRLKQRRERSPRSTPPPAAAVKRRAWPAAVAAAMLALMLGLSASSAAAQTPSGVIAGTVTDSQGGVLPGVTLTARSADTGAFRTLVTEADGRYRIAGLPPGAYDVRAELSGFGTVEVKNLTLTVGLEVIRNLTLGLQGVEEQVTVVGGASVVETSKAEVSSVVTQQQIASLPVEGRSAVTLALLAPGTGTDATRPRRPGANVGIGGISSAGTNYIGDGMNNNTLRAGDTREDIPQGAVREFRVIVSQAPAEFGGRVGGVVNIVTKSGGNLFSGEAFEFFRDKSLNRIDQFQQAQHDQLGTPINDFHRNQYGVTVGGPVVTDRLHFFVSFERKDDHQFFTVNTAKPQFYSSLEGTLPGGSLVNSIFGRGDLQLNATQHVFFRYFKQDPNVYYADGAGGTSAAFSAGDASVPGFSYIASHTWVLSPRIVNELTAMYAESFQDTSLNRQYTPAQYLTLGSARYNFPSLSWGNTPGTHFRNVYNQFREAVSVAAGSHALKIGGGAQIIPTHMISPGNPNGTWTFSTDQFFDPASPSFNFANLTGATQFTSSLPAFYPENLSHTFEAYAQDQWRPRANLTLNLGVRYDLQTRVWHEDYAQSRYPRPLPYVDFASRGDKNNVAPRLGLAWDLRNDGRSVVRAGYGIVYTNAQNSLLDGETNAFQQNTITIRNPSYPDPYQGKDPLTFVSTAAPNITIGANNLVNAPAYTTSAGFSQQLGDGAAIHLDGVYTKLDQIPTNVQINQPDPVTGIVPLPDWGRIAQTQPIGTYEYRAFLARLEKRLARRAQYSVSYTWSKQEGNTSVTDAFHPANDQGPGDTDRRHNLSVSGSVVIPKDITIGVIWTLRSALPFSALAGRDLNNDGSNTDFVPGTTKNQGNRDLDLPLVNAWRAQNGLGSLSAGQIDTSRYNRLDVRASKALLLGGRRRIELIAQVFNLLGTDNLGGVGSTQVTNALSDSFGRILTAQPRQQAELAARLAW